jgi:hypothetical protein
VARDKNAQLLVIHQLEEETLKEEESNNYQVK